MSANETALEMLMISREERMIDFLGDILVELKRCGGSEYVIGRVTEQRDYYQTRRQMREDQRKEQKGAS